MAARKRSDDWEYFWTTAGKVFARKSDYSEVIKVVSTKDLERIASWSLTPFPTSLLIAVLILNEGMFIPEVLILRSFFLF